MKSKIFLVIGLFVLLIIPSFVQAACKWEILTISSNFSGSGGGTTSSGGCNANKGYYSNTTGACAHIQQPEKNSALHQVPVCCCQEPQKETTPPPNFEIPDLQIPLDKLVLSKPNCSQGVNGQYFCEVNWLGEYMTWIYNYSLKIAGILAAIMLMAGGLLWLVSGGNPGKIGQAKDIITGSLVGLAILFGSYLLLIQINPDLVKFRSISIGALNDSIIPIPENITVFKGRCKPTTTGPCAVANMNMFGSRAEQASAICMAESGGNAGVYNKLTKCENDGYAVWGLFQFNLSAHKFIDENNNTLNCAAAYNKTWTNSSPTCKIVNRDLYNACVKAATTAELSIMNAFKLAAQGWGPWEANSKWCGF